MDIFIISGLSGSGKSIALQALEDLGYYCIDNLPAVLLTEFAQVLVDSHQAEPKDRIAHAAVSIDSRNRLYLQELTRNLATLTEVGVQHRTIFIEADEATLVKRYSETRRKHPLTDADTPLLEGIRLEKALLEPIADSAAKRINTSSTTPHELRALVRDLAGGAGGGELTLLLESFGFKYGNPRDADFVFDVRCLPNPHWDDTLRPYTGLDQPVIEFLESHANVHEMVEQIGTFIGHWLPSFKETNRSYITVAIGCTGGQHRSVYIADKLAGILRNQDMQIQVRHREMPHD